MMKITVIIDNADVEISVPSHKVVCPRCDGEGVHDHPAFRDGITSSEMEEHGAEFEQDYRSGAYDVRCEMCAGLRVVDDIDYDALSDEQKPLVDQYFEAQHELEAERAQVRRMRERGMEW